MDIVIGSSVTGRSNEQALIRSQPFRLVCVALIAARPAPTDQR